MVADLLGKEAAVFLPSGAMCNAVAVKTHTNPSDLILCDRLAHIYRSEFGSHAILSSVTTEGMAGERGRFTPQQVEATLANCGAYGPTPRLLVREGPDPAPGQGRRLRRGQLPGVGSRARLAQEAQLEAVSPQVHEGHGAAPGDALLLGRGKAELHRALAGGPAPVRDHPGVRAAGSALAARAAGGLHDPILTIHNVVSKR